jgi:phosphoenolpyruvate carboxylase
VREEDSFQGGDGYLPFFTSAAAEAAVRGLLTFGYAELASDPDPIYDQPDFAADFFAAIQQSFEDLAKDRDYALLLGLYGTRLLNRTGSRPEQRQGEGQGRVRTLSSVAELRAIPNNAILQGLADLANTTFGVARAAAKDPETFAAMMTASPRFSQALEMVRSAAALGDLAAMRAYGAAANPSLWLDRRAGAPEAEIPLLTGACSVAERLGLTSSLSRALRRIRAEPALPLEIEASDRRDRLRLLHAIRIALIQRIVLLAARLPRFTPFDAVTREDVQEQLMRLDVPGAVAILSARFPLQGQSHARGADFGEAATYRPGADQGYEREHGEIFQPLLRLHGLLLQTTTALDQEIGACG